MVLSALVDEEEVCHLCNVPAVRVPTQMPARISPIRPADVIMLCQEQEPSQSTWQDGRLDG